MKPEQLEETETVKAFVIKIPVWKLLRRQFAKLWRFGLGISIQMMVVAKQILDHALLRTTHPSMNTSDDTARGIGGDNEKNEEGGFEKAIQEGVQSVDWEAVGKSLVAEVDKVDWEDVGKSLEEWAQGIECEWKDVKIKRRRTSVQKPADKSRE